MKVALTDFTWLYWKEKINNYEKKHYSINYFIVLID